MKIMDMQVNHRSNPLGYDLSMQTFSWKYEDTSEEILRGEQVLACRVVVAEDSACSHLISDSGLKTEISGVAYGLKLALAPRTRYYWRVEAALTSGARIESGIAWFETGKLDEPWYGQWICMPTAGEEEEGPVEADLAHITEKPASPVVRKVFQVEKRVASARIYMTGLGLYECYLNGRLQNDGYLQPGYNHYNYWMQYQTVDVTEALVPGENVLSFLMGDGWYRGRFGVGGGYEKNFGDYNHLLCEMHIRYEDGTEQVIPSDHSFLYTAGPVRFSSIYDGEIYDRTALLGHEGPRSAWMQEGHEGPCSAWMQAGYDDSGWQPAVLCGPRNPGRMGERFSIPVIVKEKLKPVMITGPRGERILDLRQNMTGWVVFRDMLKRGQSVRLRFAELLKDGALCTDNLLTSSETAFVYISDGNRTLVRPHFTYFGFRYVELQGFPEDVKAEDFEGWSLYSDLPMTGRLETGSQDVNQLISNACWSQRDNFLEHPTDCPQRAERLGWTGDAQIYYKTASYFMDTTAFFRKYMKDVNEEQLQRGGLVPFIIPKTPGRGFADPDAVECSAAWSDVATVVPWMMYVYYGDKQLLAEQYPGMKAWVDYMIQEDERNGGKYLYQTGFHFGDWLALDNPEPGPFGRTDPYYIASAYYMYSTCLTAKAAKVLGYQAEADALNERAGRIRQAIQREYFDEAGICRIDTQTAYALAIYMDLAQGAANVENGKLLAQKIRKYGMHLDTGFVGTPYLCLALTKSGQHETACELLMQREAPGWLNEVRLNATTIWEAWDALDENGCLTGDASLNHYAYGSVVEWIFSDVCGIAPMEEAPGFARARISPHPTRLLGSAKVSLDTMAGCYQVSWEYRDDETVFVVVSVPLGGCGVLELPEAGLRRELPAGSYEFAYHSV